MDWPFPTEENFHLMGKVRVPEPLIYDLNEDPIKPDFEEALL